MKSSTSNFPDQQTLVVGLSSVLEESGITVPIVLVNREPHVYSSSYPSEIVTCRLDDGSELRLLCKYSVDYDHKSNTRYLVHWRGVTYETEVYRHVLQKFKGSVPRFYGSYKDPATGCMWLILEYLADSFRASKVEDGVIQAARWLGQFHAANEDRCQTASLAWLHSYDKEYYFEWVQRTLQAVYSSHEQLDWLKTLCDRIEEVFTILLNQTPTIIHGEFYPSNVLSHHGSIYPVDWESAAIAVGAIDLASLVEGWPVDIAKICELEYRKTRWPVGPPVNFDRILEAAKIYWIFFWLGSNPHWINHKFRLWYLRDLHYLGERWGLI